MPSFASGQSLHSLGLVYFNVSYFGSKLSYLDGIIKIGFVLLIVPKPIRDFFYRIFANNRYKWFGKNNCIIPTSEIKKRFLI
ncbi:DUF393 domain-containing protein [Mammaliicoccus sciuri]|uniref:DCC1-like thiol-disulfide oxidoreductase family protein n=1 Tax=Mammaliicoccus sciuri TaxID=1296 RepID=UPI000E68C304|nr:DUF393 domain-containing protein [Mammaliicoccus sciuri]RIN88131.1 DUF393 domain-containing protein [Mammaliicoccus sciuri]